MGLTQTQRLAQEGKIAQDHTKRPPIPRTGMERGQYKMVPASEYYDKDGTDSDTCYRNEPRPSATPKASSRGENCPRPYENTNLPLIHRYGTQHPRMPRTGLDI